MDKYVLFTANTRTEYNTLEEAIKAFSECKDILKFLYQPDKIYFLGTISSTGKIVGHDHAYHKDTAKCWGLFQADNQNQVKSFLEMANWHHQGSSSRSSKARLYGNGPYGHLYQSNKDDWATFANAIQRNYLQDYNITLFYKIESTYGAVDVKAGSHSNPYRLY